MNNDFKNHSWAESLTIRTYIANRPCRYQYLCNYFAARAKENRLPLYGWLSQVRLAFACPKNHRRFGV